VTLCLNISGLGWPTDLALPVVHVHLQASNSIGHITLEPHIARTACLGLPPYKPAGSDYLIAATQ
jgi:hypothetical protein